jgi:CBS domain-containing protein
VRATEFMTTEVVTTTPDTTVAAANRQLLEHRIAALPVVEDGRRLVGIVSELDLLRERVTADPRAHARLDDSPHAPPPRTVAEVMTRDVVALPDAADEAAFASIMASSGVKSIPVVSGERLVGIVGRRDLLRMLARDDAAITRDVESLLADEAAALGHWRAVVRDGEVVLRGGGGRPEQADAADRLVRTVPGVVRTRVQPGG